MSYDHETMIALAHDAFTSNAINGALITPSHVTKIHPHVRPFNGVSRTNAAVAAAAAAAVADPSERTPAPRVAGRASRPSLPAPRTRFPFPVKASSRPAW